MTKIVLRDGEMFEKAVKKFKKKVEASGVLREVRKREFYLKPSIKKKEKERAAEKRRRRTFSRG